MGAHSLRPRTTRRRTYAWLAVVGLTGTGVALTGAGVFAAWTGGTSVQTGVQSAANLGVVHTDRNGTTFTSGVDDLLPGDYLYRYADLGNTGGVAEAFSATVSGTGVLAGAGGLRVAVDSCAVSWAVDGSCAGGSSPVVTARDVAGAGTLALGTVPAGDSAHLRYTFTLAAGADQATFQGTTGRVTVAITGTAAAVGGRNRTGG